MDVVQSVRDWTFRSRSDRTTDIPDSLRGSLLMDPTVAVTEAEAGCGPPTDPGARPARLL